MELTREQAIQLAATDFWKDMKPQEIARFQLEQRCLCMPFDVFQEAMEKALGRPVWTHEFVDPESLRKELYGEKERPSLQDIFNMIPASKRIIISV